MSAQQQDNTTASLRRLLDRGRKPLLGALILCGLVIVGYWGAVKVKNKFWPTKHSSPGAYTGFSRSRYLEWERTSRYVTTRDGTKLAIDLFRPTENGVPVEEPFPAIWTHVRYQRAFTTPDGRDIHMLHQQRWLPHLVRHGYVVAAVDARGTGASYGVSDGPFSVQESEDAYDITTWLANQEWCDGNVGMFGGSYMGITQFFAAGEQPPNLKAIFPQVSNFDAYSTTHLGGVRSEDLLLGWTRLARDRDSGQDDIPVDEDQDGRLIAEARRQQLANRYPDELTRPATFRDSRDPETGAMVYAERSPLRCIEAINEAQIPVYQLAGWFDLWPHDQILWYSNLEVPQKLLIGPWTHIRIDFHRGNEHLRWFDYWLKGIDNGIMDEAPIRYFTMGAAPGQQWRNAWQWPLPNEQRTQFFMHQGKSGSVASVNDGILSQHSPQERDGHDHYTVNYSATTGTRTRWTNVYGRHFDYGDMTLNDELGLTYTTDALPNDVEVTGHPSVSIWIRTQADDLNLFAYLEEVELDGTATYVTEGRLRASHRATSEAPYKQVPGTVYHRSHQEDVVPLPQEPVKIEFSLFPTSNIFDKGHRIRLTLTCADRDNAETIEVTPPPSLDLLRNSQALSHVVLPIIPPDAPSVRVPGKR